MFKFTLNILIQTPPRFYWLQNPKFEILHQNIKQAELCI